MKTLKSSTTSKWLQINLSGLKETKNVRLSFKLKVFLDLTYAFTPLNFNESQLGLKFFIFNVSNPKLCFLHL